MTDFPKPKLDSLPPEPLHKGEQYFVDLAGNIRKGPVGKAFDCYCVPILQNVEKKMEKDKEELKEHIHTCHDNLKEKISCLEKKTSNQLITLHQTVKGKLAVERTECMNRTNRRSLRDRLEFERRQKQQVEQFKGEMRSWLETKLASPVSGMLIETPSSAMETTHIANNCEQLIKEPKSELSCERPRSCLGVTHPHTVEDKIVVSDAGVINRSKSEAHLNGELNGNDEKRTKIAVTDDCQQSTTNFINENDITVSRKQNNQIILSTANTTEQATDLMRSLRCNGSEFVPNGDYRNSPYSDSGYRTKFSPSPRDCSLPPALHHKSTFHHSSMNAHPTLISHRFCSSLDAIKNLNADNTTVMSQNSSLV